MQGSFLIKIFLSIGKRFPNILTNNDHDMLGLPITSKMSLIFKNRLTFSNSVALEYTVC